MDAMSASGPSATLQWTRTMAAFSPGADIFALVRVKPVDEFTTQASLQRLAALNVAMSAIPSLLTNRADRVSA
jgi:hypothetical protein